MEVEANADLEGIGVAAKNIVCARSAFPAPSAAIDALQAHRFR